MSNNTNTELLGAVLSARGGDVNALPDNLRTTYLRAIYEASGGNPDELPDNLEVTLLKAIAELGGGNTGGGADSQPDENIYTWASVAKAISNGTYKDIYKIGDIVTFESAVFDDSKAYMEIVAFDADEKPDGTKAPITWMSKYLLHDRYYMNDSDTNANGWGASGMRTYLNELSLPDEVQSLITPVKKTYFDKTTNSVLTCEDSIWIPSEREVFGNSGTSSCETFGAVYNYFNSNESRMKRSREADVNPSDWWTRTAYPFDNASFRSVAGAGTLSYRNAKSNKAYIAIGFCT